MVVTFDNVSVAVVAPAMLPPLLKLFPFLRHWYDKPVPVAVTLNVAVEPAQFVALTG